MCSSDMDALMRSLGGRTVPDGAVGILPAFMMVVAGCHYVAYCSLNYKEVQGKDKFSACCDIVFRIMFVFCQNNLMYTCT